MEDRTFMMPQAEALYNLQEIDLRILRCRKRLDEIESALEDNAAVIEARAQVEGAQAALAPLRAELRDLELEIQTNTTKSKNAEDRMYSGKVQNPKELQDLQNEIAALKRRNDDLETKLLDLMIEIEAAEETLEGREAELARVIEESEAGHADLLEEKNNLEGEIEALTETRQTALEDVTKDSLKTYNALRKRKANQPIARLEGKSCGVCGIEQSVAVAQAARKRDEFVECINCGRILADF